MRQTLEIIRKQIPLKIHEIPIIFHDRTVGQSKMSKKIILEAIFRVPMFRIKRLLGIK